MIVCTRTIEFFIMTDFAIYLNLLTLFAISKFVLDMSIELMFNRHIEQKLHVHPNPTAPKAVIYTCSYVLANTYKEFYGIISFAWRCS